MALRAFALYSVGFGPYMKSSTEDGAGRTRGQRCRVPGKQALNSVFVSFSTVRTFPAYAAKNP